jgi:hypothetical protein
MKNNSKKARFFYFFSPFFFALSFSNSASACTIWRGQLGDQMVGRVNSQNHLQEPYSSSVIGFLHQIYIHEGLPIENPSPYLAIAQITAFNEIRGIQNSVLYGKLRANEAGGFDVLLRASENAIGLARNCSAAQAALGAALLLLK